MPGADTPRPVTGERSARLPPLESALVGRSTEMDALGRAWNAVRRGGGRIALVEGEAGVGKTRLVEELLRRAVAEGGLVLRGRNYDAQIGLPYGLVVEALGPRARCAWPRRHRSRNGLPSSPG